ncbi:MAG: hypothetical protein ABR612_14805, partial [Chromatocurvus sp.]
CLELRSKKLRILYFDLESGDPDTLMLTGRYPRDRERIIAQAEAALQQARKNPPWFNEVPDYEETLF